MYSVVTQFDGSIFYLANFQFFIASIDYQMIQIIKQLILSSVLSSASHMTLQSPADLGVSRSSISGSARNFFCSLSELEPKNTAHSAISNTLI